MNFGRKKSPEATGDLSKPRTFFTTTTGLSMPEITETSQKQISITFTGEWFIVSPLTFAAADQLLLGLDKSEIESGFAIGDVPKDPTKFDEFLCAVGIRAINDNILVLQHLNRYFDVSLPGLESRWNQGCIGKN